MQTWAVVNWNDGGEMSAKVEELWTEGGAVKEIGSKVQGRFLNPIVQERTTNKYVISTGTIKSFHDNKRAAEATLPKVDIFIEKAIDGKRARKKKSENMYEYDDEDESAKEKKQKLSENKENNTGILKTVTSKKKNGNQQVSVKADDKHGKKKKVNVNADAQKATHQDFMTEIKTMKEKLNAAKIPIEQTSVNSDTENDEELLNVSTLSPNKVSCESSDHVAEPASPKRTTVARQTQGHEKNPDQEVDGHYGQLSKEQIKKVKEIGKTCVNYKGGINRMMDVVFTEQEMISCTPCGQASQKNKEARGALPSDGMNIIYKYIRKRFPDEFPDGENNSKMHSQMTNHLKVVVRAFNSRMRPSKN